CARSPYKNIWNGYYTLFWYFDLW
nr:immunoglobulin heavy chain junction region [Macaca mulatta]